MIDKSTRQQLAERKERVRRRINTKVDPENYEFIPAKKPIDYYDNDIRQRVAVYARVSTDNVQQTSSYELQKKYYEDFVVHHPNWTLVKIYADEGISGTSLAHRDEFNSMIADCRSGKIDMIITKSVSRFARNVVDCISMVRMLAELWQPLHPPGAAGNRQRSAQRVCDHQSPLGWIQAVGLLPSVRQYPSTR